MQNGLGESFWDAHGVEIGACANFIDFPGIREIFPVPGKNHGTENFSRIGCSGVPTAMPKAMLEITVGTLCTDRSHRSRGARPSGFAKKEQIARVPWGGADL